MSLSVVVKPNADFSSGNITRALLNQAAKPTVAVAGSIGTEEIESLSITEAKIAAGTLGNSKLQDATITYQKLAALGRGFILAGEAKSEDNNIDGGDTVRLKLPENGFLVGDGNDVKAMVFDNSSSGAISMSQYTDSSTGDTSFKYDLRNLGVRSAHIASRAINLSKLSPNGGTAVTEKTHSAVPTYDGGNTPDGSNYGLATLIVAGGAGTVLKSNGKEQALTFGSVVQYSSTATNTLDDAAGRIVEFTHGLKDADDNDVTPSLVRGVLVCQTGGDNGYAAGDEVDFSSILNRHDDVYHACFSANTTKIKAIVEGDGSNVNILMVPKGGGAKVAVDDAKWKIKVYAAY